MLLNRCIELILHYFRVARRGDNAIDEGVFGDIGNQIGWAGVGQIEFRLFWIDELVVVPQVDEEGRESAMQQSSCLDYSGVQHLLYIHLLLVILK